MTDFKTLKDMGWTDGKGSNVSHKKLKEEAIKLVKKLNLLSDKQNTLAVIINVKGNEYEKLYIPKGTKDFIKYFFNLTEEDLK